MSLKWRSLTGERDGPFSYSNSGWKKWESTKVTWFSCTTPGVPDASVGEASRKGKLMGDRRVGRELWSTSTSLVQSAHSGCCAVLIHRRLRFYFLQPRFPIHSLVRAGRRLWWDNQLSPSPTVTGIVSAPSLAEHMTDMWMAGGILCSPPPPATAPQRHHRHSRRRPPPAPPPTLSVLTHSYVKAEIKHMVLICNKSRVTRADFPHWIFIASITIRPAPVCVWSFALFITKSVLSKRVNISSAGL